MTLFLLTTLVINGAGFNSYNGVAHFIVTTKRGVLGQILQCTNFRANIIACSLSKLYRSTDVIIIKKYVFR